jgi:hypothetical protein
MGIGAGDTNAGAVGTDAIARFFGEAGDRS